MAKVEVVNASEVIAAVEGALNGARDAARQALADEVDELEADMRESAPERTGGLRGSIEPHVAGDTGEVKATARHAPFVEHGTAHTPAQPFAGPAAERSRGRFPRRVSEAVKGATG